MVGVPSELSEEEVKAFVVCATAPTDPAAIREFAAERLARFKVPRYVELVDELPHTPTGRVAKHELTRERTDGEIDFDASNGKAANERTRTGCGPASAARPPTRSRSAAATSRTS